MLNGIILENFKSYNKEIKIHLGKITVLIGPNNSGKSSILQSLILLKPSERQSSVFQPTNDVIGLGEYTDIVNANDTKKSITIGITGQEIMDIGGFYKSNLEREYANYVFKVTADERDLKEIQFYVESRHSEIDFRWRPSNVSATLRRPEEDESWKLKLNALNGFIPSFVLDQGLEELQRKFNEQFQGEFLKTIFNKIYYIPFQRTIGKYGVPLTSKHTLEQIVTRNLETTSSNLLSTLGKNPRLRQKVSELYESMYQSTMTPHNLDPDFYNKEEREVERITFMFLRGHVASSIANLGGGINQLILLFTILVGTPKGSVICLEEPEIHLHPEKQSHLMKQVLKILNEDEKQMILTTHSEYILYPLLAAVSKGELNPEDLKVYYVRQDETSLNSIVEHLDVNEHGQLEGGLKGFWDATTTAMKDFVREKDEG